MSSQTLDKEVHAPPQRKGLRHHTYLARAKMRFYHIASIPNS